MIGLELNLLTVSSPDSILHRLLNPDVLPVQLGTVVLGVLLLFFGRRLFWLFVAALGFVAATDFIAPLIDPRSREVLLVVGIIAGIAGALLAIFIQKVAVAIAGALAGGFYARLFFETAGFHDLAWIAALVGAILGAILMLVLFKWALIVFSAIAGAHLLSISFLLSPQLRGALFLVLAIFGILIQARQLRSA